MNIWKYLYKLSPKTSDRILEEYYNKPLPDNYVTDGYNNIYRVPKLGKTSLIRDEENSNLGYKYNWEKQVIEFYIRTPENEIDASNFEYVDEYVVSAHNFIDNPDYWFNKVKEEFNNEVEGQLEDFRAAEAYSIFGDVFDDDKEIYKYEIEFNYELESEPPAGSNWDDYLMKLDELLSSYDVKFELYTEEVHVYSKLELSTNKLCIDFSMPLTKDDIMEIWDSFEDYMLDYLRTNEFKVSKLYIENIMEV